MEAERIGLRLAPPDLDRLDWEGIKVELHNALVDRELYTIDDVIASQHGLTSAVTSVLGRKLNLLYRVHQGGTDE